MPTLGRKSASEKVASFLYLIATNINPELEIEKGPIKFDLPLKRADIADFLGLTIETVSRLFTRYQEEGVLKVSRREITITDLPRLKGKVEGYQEHAFTSAS